MADTIHLKNGEKIENASLLEITPTEIKYKIGERAVVYTISKNDVLKAVYNDGSEDVFSVPAMPTETLEEKETNTARIKDTTNYTLSLGHSGLGLNAFLCLNLYLSKSYSTQGEGLGLGLGFGLAENGIIAVSTDLQYRLLLTPNLALAFGVNPRTSLDVLENVTYIGVLYKQWSFNLGLRNASTDLAINAGYTFHSVKEKQVKKTEEKSESTRFFRPGIELNYPVYRSTNMADFENSFPYIAAGAGLFLRIGPEYFYFTTGAYAKIDAFYSEGVASADIKVLGIDLANIQLLDLEWANILIEIPLLLSFGSGQIKFTSGLLFDIYLDSWIALYVNEDVPLIGGEHIENIELYYDFLGTKENVHLVFGLDFDIVKHWGVGVKGLFRLNSIEHDFPIDLELSRFQTRVSTYFVF